jgi:digeranylgeranylglycerophospholipid reductase
LEEWIVRDDRFPEIDERGDIKPEEKHQGSAHIQMPNRVSSESVMGVGDTVSTIDPLWGEGIHTGMKSGNLAGITALEALGRNPVDTSEQKMSDYDDRWWDEIGDNRWERNLMTHIMYRMDNQRYDQLMEDLNQSPKNKISELNNGKLLQGITLMKLKDLPTIAEVAKNRVQQHPKINSLQDKISEYKTR